MFQLSVGVVVILVATGCVGMTVWGHQRVMRFLGMLTRVAVVQLTVGVGRRRVGTSKMLKVTVWHSELFYYQATLF